MTVVVVEASWNRSRSPVTTRTSRPWPASAAMTSSASASWAPAVASPAASRSSQITSTCGSSDSGASSPLSAATRWALYPGIRSPRQSGRQFRSSAATSPDGRYSSTSTATMSQNPRTALAGVPSGPVIFSGTEWKARNHSPALSRTMSGPWVIVPPGEVVERVTACSARLARAVGNRVADMSEKPSDVHATRLDAVRDRARALGIDHLVISSGEDMSYLTGERIDSHERLTALVVPADGGAPLLVVPALELTGPVRAAADRVGAVLRPWSDGTEPIPLVAGALSGRVAVSTALPALHLLPLQTAVDGEVLLASDILDPVRAVKAPHEIEQLAEAGRRIDAVHARMGEFLRAGRTEAQVGERITAAITEEGLTHAEFVIVGSGPNGADPHHDLSDRQIGRG